MKPLLTSVAVTALLAGPTFAQSNEARDEMTNRDTMPETHGEMAGMHGDMSGMIRTRDITGKDIYSMRAGSTDAMNLGDMTDEEWDESWNETYEVDDIGSSYADIGEIEDIILGNDGEVRGVIAEVGGFLDIGDKHVMLPKEDLKIIRSNGEAYYVTRLSEEQLEELEGVDESWFN